MKIVSWLIHAAYNLLWLLALPVACIALNLPKKGKKPYGRRFSELLGFAKVPEGTGPLVWFHSVSVGETRGIAKTVREYHKAHPEHRILVTTTTATGAEVAKSIGDFVGHSYAPLDFPLSAWLFVKRTKPSAYAIMETELWPNTLSAVKKTGCPIILMNARLSERSRGRYAKLGNAFRYLIADKLTSVLCQTDGDAKRLGSLPGMSEKTKTSGSLKHDIDVDETQLEAGKKLREAIGQRPVWLAASTHEGEEKAFSELHAKIIKSIPDALLMIAPRHPQRFKEAKDAIESVFPGKTAVRSENAIPAPTDAAYLCDTMGEMMALFEAADVAAMGGSIADIGGHNPIEPAACGTAIIMGPSRRNFLADSARFKDGGGLIEADTAEEIEIAARKLLSDPNLARQMGKKAYETLCMLGKGGAVATTVKNLEDATANFINSRR